MQNLIRQFCPSPISAGMGAVSGAVVLSLAGWLAAACRYRGVRAGDTRKLFHFCVFSAAATLRWQSDAGALIVFGAVVATGVIIATFLGPGNGLFEALARPSDAPRQRLHVLIPMLCTAVGGVAAQLIAGPGAVVAYLVGGWGDAVGEPIGIRWGRHRYRVASLGGVVANRSIEGSLAVFVASGVAASLGFILLGQTGPSVLGPAFVLAVAATCVESVSPHGLDNLTILVVTAALTKWILHSGIPSV